MARPIAPRFEITVLKDKNPPGDLAQVPAGATIHFYRQGATVANSVTVMPGLPNAVADVHDSGRLAVADTVRVGSTALTLGVSGVNSPTQIQLNNSGTDPVVISTGTRLIPTNDRPNAFADPRCTVGLGTSITSNSADGRASAYLSEDRVDYEVVISGQPTRLYIDGAGVFGRSDQMWNDLRDFGGSLQAAVDALPELGGKIFVPAGVWMIPAGVTIDKPAVTIEGEGYGSVLKAQTPDSYDLITVNQPYFRMRDVKIDGGAAIANTNGKSCVVIRGLGVSGNLVLGEYFENVMFTGAPRYGLFVHDAIVLLAQGCQFESNPGSGAMMKTQPAGGGVTTVRFIGCTFSKNGSRGCEADQVTSFTFMGCTFEGNKGGTGTSEGNGLEAKNCPKIEVLSCYFKDPDTTAAPKNLLALDTCESALVDGCFFDGGAVVAKRPERGVLFKTSRSSRLSSCTGKNLTAHLARFDAFSPDCIELGNSEAEATTSGAVVRLLVDAPRFVGMSRRAIAPPSIAAAIDRPSAATPGSLIWFGGQLQVWTGSEWKNVVLTT